jgi:hypothetical protein
MTESKLPAGKGSGFIFGQEQKWFRPRMNWNEAPGIGRLPRWMNFLLCSAVSKYLGHFPEGLIEFHILIDTLDCPALGHPATVRAAAGTVALTTANDVFLDAVQRDKKIFGSVSITSWIKEHGGTYRGFREVFAAISRRASGQS